MSWHTHPHYQVITMYADANGIFVGGGGGGGNFAKFSQTGSQQWSGGTDGNVQGITELGRDGVRRRPLRELLRPGWRPARLHRAHASQQADRGLDARPARSSRGIRAPTACWECSHSPAQASRSALVVTSPAPASASSRTSRCTGNGRPHRWGALGRPTNGRRDRRSTAADRSVCRSLSDRTPRRNVDQTRTALCC